MHLTCCRKILILSLLATCIFPTSILAAENQQAVPLPEFTERSAEAWINSTPLSVSELYGKVIMLDVWTYGCRNCYRSIPWMLTLEERFAEQGFQIIGIHTPEFEHEYHRNNVVTRMQEFKVTHPVMMDNEYSYWKALGNQYWPTFYIVDKQGYIRARFVGETHSNSVRANQIEAWIKQLLHE